MKIRRSAQPKDARFMDHAVAEARKNFTSMSGGPFGACIVRRGKVLAVARNTVLKNDATCHAEVNAIRMASRRLKTFDLSDCVMYSTTEPCPMCFSAIHWARIKKIVYGTTTRDAARMGFNELTISDARLKKLGKSKVALIRTAHIGPCQKLFKDWQSLPNKRLY